MTYFIWHEAQKLPWRQRNAAVEQAVRSFLSTAPGVFDTWTVASMLTLDGRNDKKDTTKLAQLLARMAPHMKGLATHDGAEIKRYGATRRRWQWHGQ